MSDRLEAFDAQAYRNMENISSNDYKTNKYVLYLLKEKRKHLNIVWLGNIQKEASLVKEVIEGWIE